MVLAVGDAREIPLADESVQCCITSPPYWSLRDYGLNGRGIGLEASPDEYLAQMVAVFREVRRVLRKDGTVWLNLGDSYSGSGKGDGGATRKQTTNRGSRFSSNLQGCVPMGLKPKDLIGIPWRVALALQADGWYLRSDIIWHKPNPMPESVTDRPSKAHEYVFLLAKSRRYYYDQEAVRENGTGTEHDLAKRAAGRLNGTRYLVEGKGQQVAGSSLGSGAVTRNKRTVWTITPQPYKGAHFATFPVKLVEPMVLAGTSAKGCCPECGKPWERVVERSGQKPGRERNRGGRSDGFTLPAQWENGQNPTTITTTGWRPGCDCSEVVARAGDLEVAAFEPVPCTVLDPFGGTMTVGQVCAKHGRRFVGLDLKPEYVEMGRERCATVQTAYAL